MLKYDLLENGIKRVFFLLLLVLVVVHACKEADALFCYMQENGMLTARATSIDLLCYLLLGTEKVPSGSIEMPPFLTGAIVMLMAIMIAGIVRTDLFSGGARKLVYCGNRRRYANAKLIWIVLTVAIVWMVIYVTILAYAMICGYPLGMALTTDLWGQYYAVPERLAVGSVLLVMIVLPVMTTISIGMLQVLVELLYGTFAGCASVFGLLLLSMNWMSAIGIGNYLMLVRGELFAEHGVKAYSGLAINSIWIVIACFWIRRRIIYMDVIKKSHVM